MGKSETAKLFAAEGMPVFDADAVIHELYAGEAAAMIEAAFPGTTRNGVVDRAALSKAVAGDPGALARLEGLMHPLVAERREAVSGQGRCAHRAAGYSAAAGNRREGGCGGGGQRARRRAAGSGCWPGRA